MSNDQAPRASVNWAMILSAVFIGLVVGVGTDTIVGLFTKVTDSTGNLSVLEAQLDALKETIEAGDRELLAIIRGELNTLDSRMTRAEQDIRSLQSDAWRRNLGDSTE